MSRKKKEQDERPLNIKTIQQIRDEKANKKQKDRFIDYKSDTLAARRDDIVKLVDENAQKFEKDNIELKKEFLKALCYGNSIKTTAQMLGVGRQRIYELKKKDPVFASCVDDVVKDLEFAKVVDIESELLEIKDVFNAAFVDLYNNGLFVEAAIYQKEANRISERLIDRHVQKQAREDDLKMREKELEISKGDSEEAKIININLGGEIRKIPNGILE